MAAANPRVPPDFDAMPSQPFLPDPLEGVKTRDDWAARRKWIRAQYEQWIIGKMPPPPATFARSRDRYARKENGAEVRDVRLEFGPEHKGILHVQFVIPRAPV